jgi:hypothetical protein
MARAYQPDVGDRRPRDRRGPRGWPRAYRAGGVTLLAVGLLAWSPAQALDPASGASFAVGRDTFAFPNIVRAENPGQEGLFANYCILMARAANQFFRFARFAPDEPALSPAAYTRLVSAVTAITPWDPPRPAALRVVIPGYGDLYSFSRAEEPAIKAAFGSNVLSMMHWRTWRVALRLSPRHQQGVAEELRQEVDAGRPAAIMITNFPDPDLLNHAVLVYGYRVRSGGVEFLAYDPNDPGHPLAIRFDAGTRGFWVGPLPYAPPGPIRAFRLFGSPLL